MTAVTIKEAKATLNQLVEKALHGEQVILMRGSKHVVMLNPIEAEDYQLLPKLTDEQADRFWRDVNEQRRQGRTLVVRDVESTLRVIDRKFGRKRRRES